MKGCVGVCLLASHDVVVVVGVGGGGVCGGGGGIFVVVVVVVVVVGSKIDRARKVITLYLPYLWKECTVSLARARAVQEGAVACCKHRIQ